MTTARSHGADPDGDRDAGSAASPAAALGEVWSALDVLPRARAAAPLAATTLDMVAAEVRPAPQPGAGLTGRVRRWLGPVATVVAALVSGLVAGRITAPDADAFLLRNLPLVRHLELLRELHSVEFLEALGRTGPQPPRRLLIASGRIDLQDEQVRLADEIASLRAAGPWRTVARHVEVARRDELARLQPAERERLREAAAVLADMPRAEHRRLEEVAAAVVDPDRQELREAARLWRRWVAASDPLDRDKIVDLDAAKRMEWMQRQSRLEGFGPLRPRGDGPRLDGPRGAGPRLDGPPPDGQQPLRRPRRGDRLQPPGPPDDDRFRGPFSPGPPGPASPAGPPPADAGETRHPRGEESRSGSS